jgi:hypothetical protein
MIQMAPPQPPPRVTIEDGDGLNRLHFRIWQIAVSAITVLVTGWFCTLGPLPALIALMVAKHVLVAVYVMGIDLHRVENAEG